MTKRGGGPGKVLVTVGLLIATAVTDVAAEDPPSVAPQVAHSATRLGWTLSATTAQAAQDGVLRLSGDVRLARGAWQVAANSADVIADRIVLRGAIRFAGPQAYVLADLATVRRDTVDTGPASVFWGPRRFDAQRVAISTDDTTVHLFAVGGNP